jgi:hypothetical protein
MHDEADDPLIGRIASELRRPVPARPDFEARVMAAVRAAPPALPARAWLWLREPRTLALSPLGGLAFAAGLVLVAAVAWNGFRSGREAYARRAAAEPAATVPSVVSFVLVAPEARSVAVAGDFDGWDRSRLMMRREASGLWTLSVPLAPGRYRYAFVVDGRQFVADPTAPPAVDDDFGQPTSVVTVSGARTAGGAL